MNKKKYIAAVSCLVAGLIGFGSVYVTEMNVKQRQEQKQQLEQTAKKEEPKESKEASTIVKPKQPQEIAQKTELVEKKQETQPAPNEIVEEAEEEVVTKETSAYLNALHFEAGEGLVWPLEGDVLLNYSMDATTYFPTLDQYRYNPAIVISGNINDTVLVVAKGQISEITTNEVTGCTVKQDLGDGYTAIYGQLKEVNFEVGDMVSAGQVIGYVNEPTKYYAVEGSNLYFAMEKDGEPINPMEYFR